MEVRPGCPLSMFSDAQAAEHRRSGCQRLQRCGPFELLQARRVDGNNIAEFALQATREYRQTGQALQLEERGASASSAPGNSGVRRIPSRCAGSFNSMLVGCSVSLAVAGKQSMWISCTAGIWMTACILQKWLGDHKQILAPR